MNHGSNLVIQQVEFWVLKIAEGKNPAERGKKCVSHVLRQSL